MAAAGLYEPKYTMDCAYTAQREPLHFDATISKGSDTFSMAYH